MQDTKQFTGTVEKVVYGGEGLIRKKDSPITLVPYSLPGEEIIGNITKSLSKSTQRGEISQIIHPSLHRVSPQCSAFSQCGGCHLQHASHNYQLELKHAMLVESLARIGKIAASVLPVLAVADAWYYRNHVQWEIVDTSTGPQLGYMGWHAHTGIAFETCLIASAEAQKLAAFLNQSPGLLNGLKRIHVRQNQAGEMLLGLLPGLAFSPETQAQWLSLRNNIEHLKGIVLLESKGASCIWGQQHLDDTFAETKFQVSIDSFFQVNFAATHLMLKVIAQFLPQHAVSFIDLYSGVGLFGLIFRNQFDTVTLVESAPSSIQDAQFNIAQNQAKNVLLHRGLVEEILQSLEHSFSVAIVDPPRQGCDKATLNWLSGHIQQKLIYVSCDPTTLARDLKHLLEQGWCIEVIQPIDMFPQTYHIETVVVLNRV